MNYIISQSYYIMIYQELNESYFSYHEPFYIIKHIISCHIISRHTMLHHIMNHIIDHSSYNVISYMALHYVMTSHYIRLHCIPLHNILTNIFIYIYIELYSILCIRNRESPSTNHCVMFLTKHWVDGNNAWNQPDSKPPNVHVFCESFNIFFSWKDHIFFSTNFPFAMSAFLNGHLISFKSVGKSPAGRL